jgi:hypothetical protein
LWLDFERFADEAIRLLKEALNEQRAHSAELEAQLNDLTP